MAALGGVALPLTRFPRGGAVNGPRLSNAEQSMGRLSNAVVSLRRQRCKATEPKREVELDDAAQQPSEEVCRLA